jgi:hypothetical protein
MAPHDSLSKVLREYGLNSETSFIRYKGLYIPKSQIYYIKFVQLKENKGKRQLSGALFPFSRLFGAVFLRHIH